MNKILLSIIVPVYKVENHLTKCVDSLINACKNYINNIEILLIDDGSPDKCPEICDNLSNKYSVVKTIHKQNGGVSSARNMGIENAKGKYITFCDSDDYVTEKFSKIFDYIYKYPSVEIFSSGLIKDNKFINKFNAQLFNPKQFKDLFEIIKKDVSVSCCTKIIKSSFIKSNNILFPNEIKSEDFAWSNQLLFKSSKYMLIDVAYYIYVNRSSSATHNISLEGIKAQINNYRRVKNIVLSSGFIPKQQKQLLKYLMIGYIYTIYTSKFLSKSDLIKAKLLFNQNQDLLYAPTNLKLFLYYIKIKLSKP